MTLSLTGIGDSPIPRRAREFRFAQGNSTGAGNARRVILVGNKTSAGSEVVETIGDPIADMADMETRFGKRSELRWMYYAYTQIDQNAPVYAIAVAESAGSAAAVTFTLATTAADVGTWNIDWGGQRLQANVASGDTAIVQAAAIVAKINADPALPFTAVQPANPNDHKVTVTASQLGPRGDYILNALRITAQKSFTTTATKGSLTVGTTSDDITNAVTAVSRSEFFYHAIAATATGALTTTDNGVGEYIDGIKTQALPANGKDQLVCVGIDIAQSTGTTIVTSAAANSVYAAFARVKNNDWFPGMIAAALAAVKRSQEVIYPAANLAGYTSTDTTKFPIPDPYTKSDRPSNAEIAADINNGITPFAFRPDGTAYIPRQITSYSWVGSSATKDYRAREGHIPSVQLFAWEELARRYDAQKQPNVANDPPKGQKPIKGFDYPSTMRKMMFSLIDDLAGPFINGMALLDPSPEAIKRMKESVIVELAAAGFGVTCTFEPVRHNLFDDFLLQQGGPAY